MATNGNRGRFSERLKKIAFRKRNRIKYSEDNNVKLAYNNVLKVLAAIPGMVYTNIMEEPVINEKENTQDGKKTNVLIDSSLINDKEIEGKRDNEKNVVINIPVFKKKEEKKVVIDIPASKEEKKKNVVINIPIFKKEEKLPSDNIDKVDVNDKINMIESNDGLKVGEGNVTRNFDSIIIDKKSKKEESIISQSTLKNDDIITVENREEDKIIVDTNFSEVPLDNLSFNKVGITDSQNVVDVDLEEQNDDFAINNDKEDLELGSVSLFDSDTNYYKTSVGVAPKVSKGNIDRLLDEGNKKEFKSIYNQSEQKLAKEILNNIKKKLVLYINNLEILQSELYVLSEVNGDDKKVLECEKKIKEIKELLKKIEKLKDKYDYLRDNYDFEYLMTLDDDNLIQKITELREGCGKKEVKGLVEDYKLLDEYKFLYLKVDKIGNKVKELEVSKKQDLEKLKERDIDFEELKNKVYNVSSINNSYNQFVIEQNQIVKDLNENISKITSYEQITYRFVGFNKLLANSFKYLGLLMLRPLRGSMPAIAMETLITYNMVKNLYNNLSLKEDKKVIYEAIDYEKTVNNIIENMDLTSNLIDNSLSDIVKLKMEYSDKFSKYEGDFSEYKDVICKINDIENKILGNKIKVEIIKKQAIEQKKANNKKLILVDKLNSSDKNNNFY